MANTDPVDTSTTISSDMAEHVADARLRARRALSVETHLGGVDDWRHALVSARNSIMLVWLLWTLLAGYGASAASAGLLIAAGIVFAIFTAVSAALAVVAQCRYFDAELERERHEIRTSPEHEREEVRLLYEAKGFREPLLTDIVDTLCADDDRLLKVMMEEELGLFVHQMNHPLVVGLLNFVAAVIAGLVLTVPVVFLDGRPAEVWMVLGTAGLLIAIALASRSVTGAAFLPLGATWIAVAGVCGGASYFLAQLLRGAGG